MADESADSSGRFDAPSDCITNLAGEVSVQLSSAGEVNVLASMLSASKHHARYFFSTKSNVEEAKSLFFGLKDGGFSSISDLTLSGLAKKIGVPFQYSVDEQSKFTNGGLVLGDVFRHGRNVISISVTESNSRLSFNRLLSQHQEPELVVKIVVYGPVLKSVYTTLFKVVDVIRTKSQVKIPKGLSNFSPEYFFEGQKSQLAHRLSLIDKNVSYAEAEYTQKEVVFSKLMTNRAFRAAILFVVSSSGITEEQFDEKFGPLGGLEDDLRDFLVKDYVNRETLVKCSKNNVQLARIGSDRSRQHQLRSVCPHCKRKFKDETHQEIIFASPALIELTKKSRWMSVLVTDVLEKAGVPRQNVVWNVSFQAEEIDMIAYINGTIWMCELKDKEFSADQAKFFDHRRRRVEPYKSLIIASSVSPDARAIFNTGSALYTQSILGGGESKLPAPEIIDNLDDIDTILSEMVHMHYRIDILNDVDKCLDSVPERIATMLVFM